MPVLQRVFSGCLAKMDPVAHVSCTEGRVKGGSLLGCFWILNIEAIDLSWQHFPTLLFQCMAFLLDSTRDSGEIGVWASNCHYKWYLLVKILHDGFSQLLPYKLTSKRVAPQLEFPLQMVFVS